MSASACCREGVSRCIVDGVAVERVERRMVDGIELSDYTWCNTNNHRDTERYRQLQEQGGCWYTEALEETRMERWSSVLAELCGQRLLDRRTVIITAAQQQRYFKPASQLAMVGARASRLLREEAEDLAAELQSTNEPISHPPTHGWFVRTAACSPKDAFRDGGAGPHRSLSEVLLALLASQRIHKSMRDYSTDTTLYLMPYDPAVTIDRELRVFVHESRVTAMSQYDCLNPSGVFAKMDSDRLADVALCVDAFHRHLLSPRWEAVGGVSSYVMDVEYIEYASDTGEDSVRLIELNCFGAEYAAGSALFHWVHDSAELYSSSRLCIRVLSEE